MACRTIHNLPFNTHTNKHFKNKNKIKLTVLNEPQISKHMFKCIIYFYCLPLTVPTSPLIYYLFLLNMLHLCIMLSTIEQYSLDLILVKYAFKY